MKNINIGDDLFIQIMEAEWYGKLIAVDSKGIEFEVSSGKAQGNIVYSTERFTVTKIKPKDECLHPEGSRYGHGIGGYEYGCGICGYEKTFKDEE